jgi:hypothetical protein
MIPLPNPFDLMGSVAGKIVVDGWTAGMLAIWNGGLWLLRLVLGWVDSLLSPDLSEHGPAAELYRVTFWLAGVVLLVMVIVQIGIAASRRDGKGLARALIGVGQFAIVWGGWIGYTVAVTAACSGLTRALMESVMNVTSWGAWQPWTPIDPKDITDAATATVLGLMGLLVWLAAIAHVIVMLTRAAALMVIVATTPIAAAGLANDTTRAWFWKAFRWFHAAALTPVVVVLVTGIGMKFAEGVANGQSTGALQAIATAVPAVVLICVASFSPLALFKLLAFVDPGTASGAAMRAGMTAVGGLQGLLRGNPAAGETAASQSDESGRSAGESDSEGVTSARIANSVGSAASFLGVAGAVAATGIGAMARIGTASAAVGADVTNQAGIGHNSYYPDYSGSGGDGARANREARGTDDPGPADSSPPEPEPPAVAPAPPPTSPPATSLAAASPAGGAGAGGAAAGGGSAAEAAAVAV